MKNFWKWSAASLMMAAMCITFCACGNDDDDEPNEDGNGSGNGTGAIVVSPSNVFTGLIPNSAMGASITYDSNGQVAQIVTEDGGNYDFTYGSGLTSRFDSFYIPYNMVLVKYTKDGYYSTLRMEIGDNGFVKSCVVESEDDWETWEFGYNSDNQLNCMKRSEGGNKVTNIIYQNGNITKVTMYSEEYDGVRSDYTISYTSANVPSMIENKGCLMLFDWTFGIDMDEMGYMYYAGLLGKATKNLPVAITEAYNWNGGEETETDTFVWEINENGYPIKMTIEPYSDSYSFAW